MKNLHFNFRDLFRSARIAFGLQRVWINGIGLLAGYLVYLIFTYISLIISGHSFVQVWYMFGLLPCAFALPLPWYGMLVYIIGLLLLIAIILLTNTAVSRVVYMVLRDELFYSWTQAYRFALRKWISVLGSMVTFIFLIAFFVIAALVMGLLGRIPFIGELGTAILTIPYLMAVLLLFFISVVFGVGIFIIPAIVATADEDALGSVFQSFSISFNQPWRLLIYGTVIGVLEFVGVFLLAAVFKISFRIFIWLFSIGMGSKIIEIKTYALSLINKALPPIFSLFHSLPGDLGNVIYLTHQHADALPLSGTVSVSAYIIALSLLFLGGVVLAYGAAIGNAGLTIIYVILYKFQENENILEREDEELKEEEQDETEGELKEEDKRQKEENETNADAEEEKEEV